jgi:hypothetical protein
MLRYEKMGRIRVFGAFAALAIVVACGEETPPLVQDPTPKDAQTNDVGFGEAGTPTCNAGPDLGVCACTELSFLSDAPNLYFVLDRSGSMADNGKWNTVRIVVAQVMKSLGPRAKFGVAIFPNPNDDNACAPGLQVMSVRAGDAPAGKQGPTTSTMLAVTSAPPNGGTPTAASLKALLPTLSSLQGRSFVILATDGGPNCNGAATCTSQMCIDNIENLQGCPTNGAPNCCDTAVDGPYAPLDCLDEQPTVSAIQAIATVNIPTYVIGVPGSAPYASLLDDLAAAGGTARSGSPLYYRVDSTDEAALTTALAQIAAKITATCTLTLSSAPPDPTHVNVYFDNQPVPADPVNGWTLDGSTVTLVGAACDEVMSGTVLNVRVVAGCPTVQPN